MSAHPVFRRLLAGLVLVLFLSGCAAQAGAKPQGPATVNITADEFSFKSSLTTFQAGVPYHFVVTNKGKIAHEIMIMQPLPAGTTMSMDEMDKMALMHIEANELQPGATATVDYTFGKPASPGTLEFACRLPGHYEAGMKLPIDVN